MQRFVRRESSYVAHSHRAIKRSLTPLVIVFAGLIAASALHAAPAERGSSRNDQSDATPSITVGPAVVSLESTRNSVPIGAGLDYTAVARYSEPIEYLQVRMRLLHPTGRLIYQKTFIEQSLESGTTSFVFERELSDIGLPAGSYPLELSVRVAAGGEIADEVLETELRIYDPERAPLPVATFGRISAQPLSDPSGTFVSDPGQYTRARDDVATIAAYVISDSDARISLALSPVMLEEWQRVSGGYRFAGAEGVVEIDASESTPQAYAAALDTLKRAVETGRLEVTSLGYSDPNLNDLASAGMVDDVADQYALGESASFAALGASPSDGTAPPDGSIPPAALSGLEDQGLRYVVVSDEFTRVGDGQADPGRYRAAESSLTALVTDGRSSDLMVDGLSEGLWSAVFAKHLAHQMGEPLPLLVTVGPGAAEAQVLVDAVRALGREQWIDLRGGSEVASGPSSEQVVLAGGEADDKAPADYWQTVRESRRWAEALASALPTGTADVEQAKRDSLIAQSSTWSGVAGEWTPAWRGLAFASSALQLSQGILQDVVLDVKPVTLAGTSGQVPVTITSESDEVLELTLTQQAGRSIQLGSPERVRVTVSPGENFIELPVELVNVLSSELQVSLVAAEVELAEETVEVKASYLDRLALVAGVIVLLGALLLFIIFRVRSAEAASSDAENGSRR